MVEDFLEILADIAESEVQTLQGLQLGGYTGGEGSDGDVADIAEEMLDADFLCFFCFDGGGGVDEGAGCCCAVLLSIRYIQTNSDRTYIFDLIDGKIRIRRNANLLGLDVDNDE